MTTTDHTTTCDGKRRYPTEGEAIRACIETSKKFGHPMRYYPQGHPCKCGGWHVTSRIRSEGNR